MHPQYQKALKLRLAGESYGEIRKSLGVSKSTLSLWFKNLQLPSSAQKILKKKDIATRQQLLEFNRRRTEIITSENQKIRQKALDEINSISKNTLKLIGAALYWTEGYKFEKQKGTQYICFSNSDPCMIALFLQFLRKIIQIPEEKFRVAIHIYPDTNEKSSIKFWSQVTNIPQERFRITRQVSRASQGKRPFNSLPYGTLRLLVSGRQNCFQIQGWIDVLKQQSGWK